MALTIEWHNRIKHWSRCLPRLFYRPLLDVEFSGFVTLDRLTAAQAGGGDFQPMPAGTKWGAKWEYGWFRSQVTLPAEARGERIVLRIGLGCEELIYVNGHAAGARDQQHKELTLAHQGTPGDSYDILVESYAGHGPMVCGGGPCPAGTPTVPEPPARQQEIQPCSVGIWVEEAYQLWLDVMTLYHLRETMLDKESLRVQEIDAGLRDFTTLVDPELAGGALLETCRAGRRRLKPLLECRNGSTAPEFWAFGHAHIDTAWLWPLAETWRKCARTFSNQLALMAEYPEHKFLCSQPEQFRWMQLQHPELYARIKAAADAGQWLAEGGMWVEADTNVPSGEALIRQFIHGKRFFADEFGVDSELMWLPDVFGYSGALPQIMAGCGIKYFSTQKIYWGAYTGAEPFPFNTFWWEGIDGTAVLSHFHNDYNALCSPDHTLRRWHERVQKDGLSSRLFPFGFGDGGGGATRDHLEFLRRQRDLEGAPRMRVAGPIDFFKDLERRGTGAQRYVGELYFAAHRGTYTTQAKTKRGNRKSEAALREAEFWSVAAAAGNGLAVPAADLDAAWKIVLLNQFHDILPGSSIQRVYAEAEADYAKVIETAERIRQTAVTAITDDAPTITVFNSLSWQRQNLVELPQGTTDLGVPIQQLSDGTTVAEVTAPSCGWTPLARGAAVEVDNTLTATGTTLENELLRVEFDARGGITSLFDKYAGRELTAGVCNDLRLYKDVPNSFDAWDIDSMYEQSPVPLEDEATIEVLDAGPLVARLRIARKLHDSTLTQIVSLRRDSMLVRFDTSIDWQESHKLLKVNFPVDYHADEALHEIQFGHLRRPTHKSRKYDADRFEVSNRYWTALVEEGRGLAVLNDCKYGVSVARNSINLTLLKSALAPDMTADKGRQQFTYAVCAWTGPFVDSPVVRQGYELNHPLTLTAGTADERSLFAIDADNVILETVKPAEDGSGDVILRLYESKRTATRCTLSTTLPLAGAAITDMLERPCSELDCARGAMPLDLRPFEIKTLRLRLS